jgi:hypothetical protein
MKLLDRQPVRVALYTALAPICGVLVARGVLTEDLVPVVLAVAAAVLGVTATEVAHKKTEPVAVTTIPEAPPESAEVDADVVDAVAEDDEPAEIETKGDN